MRSLSLKNAPVGVMDSGVGGISVLMHIHALLPHEDFIYFADSRYAPYGSKSAQAIQSRCFAVADFLLEKGVKSLVVACNTATAAAIADLRQRYALPIIGMEPAVKPAAAASKSGVIGVLATVGTLKSAQFAALLESYGRNVQVVTQGCDGLVECVERGELNSPNTLTLIAQYCAPLLNQGADTIVLGCTHYPFLRAQIQQCVGPDVILIDTGAAVASRLQHVLATHDLLAMPNRASNTTLWTNSCADDSAAVIRHLWGKSNTQILSVTS